jgi:hypothetical protein
MPTWMNSANIALEFGIFSIQLTEIIQKPMARFSAFFSSHHQNKLWSPVGHFYLL